VIDVTTATWSRETPLARIRLTPRKRRIQALREGEAQAHDCQDQESQACEEGAPAQEGGAGKPQADPSNKKAEVIALMKRAKEQPLAEIMTATGWHAHTVRGFVSILGSNGGEKIEIVEERRRGTHASHRTSSPQPSETPLQAKQRSGVSQFV
jgi:hypothetical protein